VPLDFARKQNPSGIGFFKTLCIEVLQHHDRAEPVVVVAVAIGYVGIEHTSIATIIAIATTYHERIGSITV
jgi:hypothetical protein